MNPLLVIVDSRVRMPLAGVPLDVRSEIFRAFTYVNPDYAKAKKLQETMPWVKLPSKAIAMWRQVSGELSVPRGGMPKVREILRTNRVEYRAMDRREPGEPVDLPLSGAVTLWDFQREIVDAGEVREQGIIRSPTGCIAGSAKIGLNRAGKGFSLELSRVVEMFNGGTSGNRKWEPTTQTFVRAPFPDGTVRLARLLSAKASGVRPVYEVETAGNVVQATADHRFLTPFGWVELERLDVGDFVLVDAGIQRKHEGESWRNIASRLVPVRISGIEYAGEVETFDLEVERASAFMANGVAVHNSGKTTAAIALASRLGVRTLVVVWTKALLDQWRRRLATELAIDPGDIGVVQGKRRGRAAPIVVGMQQTLYRMSDEELAPYGCVILDETHRAAARTFVEVIDRMPARYRFGFSDDERRKDRKEFLTYDVFGDVIAEVSRKELEDRGIVHDVELRVVPTAFRAEWYEELEGPERAAPQHHKRLLDELVVDVARNKLAVDLACGEAKQGETVLVFSLRVEHCRLLRADIAKREPRVGLLVGEASAGAEDDFERTREGLASGEIRVGVGTYQAAGTGVDLPSVSRGLCTTPIHTNKQFFGQVRGRVCRVDRSAGAEKTDARLYYLWDRAVHGLSALRKLTGWTRRSVVFVDGEWVDAKKWVREQEAKDEAKQERHRSEWFPGFDGGVGC